MQDHADILVALSLKSRTRKRDKLLRAVELLELSTTNLQQLMRDLLSGDHPQGKKYNKRIF